MPQVKQFLLVFWEILEILTVAFLSLFLVYTFLAKPFVVQGASMEPSFFDGDYILIDEITYRFREPQRGEVIVFKNPANETEFYIKRIVGLPGEEVVINADGVKVNGMVVDKNGRSADYYAMTGERVFRLGKDEYFVMGDNRAKSFDSRNWGPLKRYEITGAVRLRFWPLNKIQIFRGSMNYLYS
jgi:signal peptidase I